MTRYSTSDLSRKSGDIIAEALRRPVTITQRNKPRLVLLSIEDFRRLTAKADTRKAGRLETMPDEVFREFQEAVTAHEQDGGNAPQPNAAMVASTSSGLFIRRIPKAVRRSIMSSDAGIIPP